MSETKNFGKSIRARLLNVAKQEEVFYQTILTRYFQERLLYRISQTRYRENFYLKGGALMYAYSILNRKKVLAELEKINKVAQHIIDIVNGVDDNHQSH